VVAGRPAGAGRAGWLGVALLAGCSGTPRAEDAAHGVVARDDAAPVAPATSRDAAPADPARGGSGDLQVRVEWPDTPVAARSSPGRTRCNTPRLPAVTPTTTWGIPDVVVVIEGAAPPATAARITVADCALTPRIAVGDSLAITSALDRPAKLLLRKRGALDEVAAASPAAPSPAIPVLLPIAGHTVTAALEPSVAYSLETDASTPEVAVVAAIANGYVTEANGQVVARELAVGPHAVTVWLPARAGQPGRSGRGTATITAGDLATLTISLAP
jgi:hypothetical protein